MKLDILSEIAAMIAAIALLIALIKSVFHVDGAVKSLGSWLVFIVAGLAVPSMDVWPRAILVAGSLILAAACWLTPFAARFLERNMYTLFIVLGMVSALPLGKSCTNRPMQADVVIWSVVVVTMLTLAFFTSEAFRKASPPAVH